MGKHRPEYTPHVDSGDCVIVTNAQNVVMTGRKLEQKTIQSFSGYPGGQKVRTYKDMMEKHPERIIELAVTRMLPKGRLGRQMGKKLHVYTGADHPHQAQQPMTLEIN
jgi:large subunit ribosomal protein L13